MIATMASNIFRPQLRKDIVLGPPGRRGGVTVYYMKDRLTNWFYRIGAKEHFILSRMDGSRTLQEIGEEYVLTFKKRLDERAWARLFELLERRQLLITAVNADRLEELTKEAEKQRQEQSRGWLRRRFQLVNPDALLEKILPWVRFAFKRTFVIPALIAFILLEIFVVSNLRTLGSEAWSSPYKFVLLPMFLAVLWITAVLHETAHGLTCKNFGGSVREMGILWRYLSFFPYCKLDDIMLFHRRSHRVYAAFAGPFLNLLMLLLFGLLWWLAPAQSLLKDFSAYVLLALNMSTITNFIPFIELDGYFMLSHSLGMVDLRKEANRFWIKVLSKLFLRKEADMAGYQLREKCIYLLYGFFSFIFTMFFLASMLIFWFVWLRQWIGDLLVWSLLLAFVLVLLYRGPGKFWLKNRFKPV